MDPHQLILGQQPPPSFAPIDSWIDFSECTPCPTTATTTTLDMSKPSSASLELEPKPHFDPIPDPSPFFSSPSDLSPPFSDHSFSLLTPPPLPSGLSPILPAKIPDLATSELGFIDEFCSQLSSVHPDYLPLPLHILPIDPIPPPANELARVLPQSGISSLLGRTLDHSNVLDHHHPREPTLIGEPNPSPVEPSPPSLSTSPLPRRSSITTSSTSTTTQRRRKSEPRKDFLERNRVAASKCRAKKKEWQETLEARAQGLEKENASLRQQVFNLQQELDGLKSVLDGHEG